MIRVAVAVTVLLALTTGAWKMHHMGVTSGRLEVQTKWDADIAGRTAAALLASEATRSTERGLRTTIAGIDRELQVQKSLRVAADKRTADSLQRLNSVLATADTAGADPAAASGVAGDDPRNAIIGECARDLGSLDAAYGKLVDQAKALQKYAVGVRVTP